MQTTQQRLTQRDAVGGTARSGGIGLSEGAGEGAVFTGGLRQLDHVYTRIIEDTIRRSRHLQSAAVLEQLKQKWMFKTQERIVSGLTQRLPSSTAFFQSAAAGTRPKGVNASPPYSSDDFLVRSFGPSDGRTAKGEHEVKEERPQHMLYVPKLHGITPLDTSSATASSASGEGEGHLIRPPPISSMMRRSASASAASSVRLQQDPSAPKRIKLRHVPQVSTAVLRQRAAAAQASGGGFSFSLRSSALPSQSGGLFPPSVVSELSSDVPPSVSVFPSVEPKSVELVVGAACGINGRSSEIERISPPPTPAPVPTPPTPAASPASPTPSPSPVLRTPASPPIPTPAAPPPPTASAPTTPPLSATASPVPSITNIGGHRDSCTAERLAHGLVDSRSCSVSEMPEEGETLAKEDDEDDWGDAEWEEAAPDVQPGAPAAVGGAAQPIGDDQLRWNSEGSANRGDEVDVGGGEAPTEAFDEWANDSEAAARLEAFDAGGALMTSSQGDASSSAQCGDDVSSDLDDVSDLDDEEPLQCADLIVAQFENVQRPHARKSAQKGLWRIKLRHGILQIGGREVLFNTLSGEFVF